MGGRGGAAGAAGVAMDGGRTPGLDATRGDAANASIGVSDARTTAVDCGVGACPAAWFVDNFDSYAAGAAPKGMWKTSAGNGAAVVVDGTHAFSGRNAVHVVSPGAQAYERAFMSLEGAPLFPLPNNATYGRMMLFTTVVPANVVHWTIIQAEGRVPGMNINWAVYRYGGQFMGRLMANYDSSPLKSDCWKHSQTVLPQNRWACVEWQLDGSTNTMRFWLDGKPLNDLTVVQKGEGCIAHETMDNWWAPAFSAIRLGWEHYQQGPGELWIDDVALDANRIGCPTPQ